MTLMKGLPTSQETCHNALRIEPSEQVRLRSRSAKGTHSKVSTFKVGIELGSFRMNLSPQYITSHDTTLYNVKSLKTVVATVMENLGKSCNF